MHKDLIARLDRKQAVIGIIGMGYVGLPLSLRFAEAGYHVIGLDIDKEKTEKLNRGESYIEHVHADRVAAARSGRFEASADIARVNEADAIIICVPTPLNQYREPDLSYVINTTESILPHLKGGQIVSLESTTYPGTTDEELKPRIESRGFKVGRDIFLVFSPEREDPGNARFTTQTIPKICGGVTPVCLEAGLALYRNVIDRVIAVSSARTAMPRIRFSIQASEYPLARYSALVRLVASSGSSISCTRS